MLLLSLACYSEAQDSTSEQPPVADAENSQDKGSEKSKGKVSSEVQQRELGADEDPMAAAEAKREAERVEESRDIDKKPERTTGFDVYGSLRLRYRKQGEESEWQDGGSRMGADLDWQFREGSFLFARYEIGFNLITGIQDLNPGKNTSEEFEDSIFTRLGHVSMVAPGFTLVAGKN